MRSPEGRAPKGQPRGVVVDASVVLKLLLPEDGSVAVRRLWAEWVEADVEIAAPYLLAYEVTSVLRQKIVRSELPAAAGEAAFAAFRAQAIALLHPDGIEERAWDLARQWQRPTTYDTTYLALAELADRDFWTADRRFAASLRGKVPRLRLVPR